MNNSIELKLSEILAGEPKEFDIEESVSIGELYFPKGIIKKIVVENYAGLKQMNLYSGSKKIATYVMFEKTECKINKTIEDGENILVISVK